jgi:hypothetical protein
MELYQEIGDDGDDNGADGGGKKPLQATVEETCVWGTAAAYIHGYTDDGDDEPLSLM